MKLRGLLVLAFPVMLGAATITVDQNISFQTIAGWENGKVVKGMAGTSDADTTLPYICDDLVDMLIDSIGLTRVRMEVRCGAENPVDNYAAWRADTSDSAYQLWRTKRYEAINDNDDPLDLNMAGFHFTEYDYHMNRIIVPLRQKMQSRGEELYVNLCFVAFGGSVTPRLQRDPAEYAEFMLAVFIHTENTYGFVPSAVEIILEPDVAGFGDGTRVGQCMVAAGDLLKANGYTPDFIGPSNTNLTNAIKDFDLMIQVPGVTGYLSELSYHAYAGRSDANLQALAGRSQSYGVGCAMLEWWSYNNANFHRLHRDLTMGMNTAWQMKQSLATEKGNDGNGEGLVEVDFTDGSNYSLKLKPDVKYIRHYWKYIRPGAVRKAASSSNANFEPLAFINTDGNAVMVVKANAGGAFTVGGMPAGTYGFTYSTGNPKNQPTAYDVRYPGQTITAGGTISTSIPAAGVITIFQTGGGSPAASHGELEFAASAYAAAESVSTVTVTVNRVGGSDSAVSVRYLTSDGSATEGEDYDAASGTLHWTDGDASAKTFSITILDDTTAESDETITVALSTVTGGASPGTPFIAVITITDNDSAVAPDTSDTTGTPPDSVIPAALQGHWGFENNADDRSGNGRHGTWSGAAVYGTGRVGQAMSSAAGDYVTVGHADGLDGMAALTWSLWVNRNAGAPTADVVYKHQSYRLRIMSDRCTGTLYNQAGASKDFSVLTSAFTDSQWHHVAFSWDGATIRTYLDGIPKAAVAFAGTLATQPTRNLVFGKNPWGNAFDGMLDEVKLYSGALDSAEIAVLADPDPVQLPVKYSSFTAEGSASGIILAWATVSETDCLGFHVLRGTAANGFFERVSSALIPGAGSTMEAQQYTFEDTSAVPGTWYYRLQQVDTGGQNWYSHPVQITWQPTGLDPFPSSHAGLTGWDRARIYGMNGSLQRVMTAPGKTVTIRRALYRAGLPRGVYLVEAEKNGRRSLVRTVLIR